MASDATCRDMFVVASPACLPRPTQSARCQLQFAHILRPALFHRDGSLMKEQLESECLIGKLIG